MNIADLMLMLSTHFVVTTLCAKSAANPNAKDFYERLGLKKGATDGEIKRSFKKLALEYHPDKNKDPNAQEEFTRIAEAYETLKDPKKRKDYDRGGFNDFFGGEHFDFNFGSFFKEFDRRFKGDDDGTGSPRNSEFSSSPFSSFFDFGDDPFQTAFDGLDTGSFFGAGQMHSQIFNQDIYSDGKQHCTTTTRKVGNTIETRTTCS